MEELSGTYNVLGPPGTGKTTFIARQVARLVEEYGPDSVMIASLTKAAAQEVAGRKLPLNKGQVGTLHSHCYRAVGNPEIAETHSEEWNNSHNPRYHVSHMQGAEADEELQERSGRLNGDQILNRVNLYRAKMIEPYKWDTEAQIFHTEWEKWKNENGYFDFTDLVAYCLRDIDYAPGYPDFLIVDESQDMDRLSTELVKKWSDSTKATIFAGDPWQCQPPGTMVFTRIGEVPIEDLDITRHKLMSYPIRSNGVQSEFLRPVDGLYWMKEERYEGPLYTVTAGHHETSGSADHLWVIRCDEDGASGIRVVKSTDLPPEGFSVAVRESRKGTRVRWVCASVRTSLYSGPIFSLRVEPFHTYVADGIVTHNCIYTWRGSDPDGLNYIEKDFGDSHVRPLKKSYRLPASVHEYATTWMKQLSTYRPIEFYPREFQGRVRVMPDLRYTTETSVANLADSYVRQGKRVMILAGCSYHLWDITAALKFHGVPFHNPYRRRRGDWNPLHVSRGKSISDRILSFMRPSLISPDQKIPGHPPWPLEDLQDFIEIIGAKEHLRHGAKKAIKNLRAEDDSPAYSLDDFERWFTSESYKAIMKLDLDWFLRAVGDQGATKQKQIEYPRKIINNYGIETLHRVSARDKDLPGIVTIGTIHSVKGGEAEIVILIPDLSPAAMEQWDGSPTQRDAVLRVMYVGMTRAKEELIILGPGSRQCIDFPSPEPLD